MNETGIKYFSVTLLLLLFIFKGMVTLLPVFTDFYKTTDSQEMKLNNQSENSEENNNEKKIDIKEFLGHFYNSHSSSLKYAFVSKTIPATYCRFETEVFLPVNTPPPKQVL